MSPMRNFSLFRPRRAPPRPTEGFGIRIHARAFDRACSRIELPGVDWLVGLVGVGLSFLDFLSRIRLRPLASLGFGHVCVAFPLPYTKGPY